MPGRAGIFLRTHTGWFVPVVSCKLCHIVIDCYLIFKNVIIVFVKEILLYIAIMTSLLERLTLTMHSSPISPPQKDRGEKLGWKSLPKTTDKTINVHGLNRLDLMKSNFFH